MQTPAKLVTSRQVQNSHTGLDLFVPEYQEIRGKMMSGHVEYQIVAVTCLAAFKSTRHKSEDVVQFMVSKKYSEIEEFYQKLATRYPEAALPLLPRKMLLVGESDIRERRVAFDEIMRYVSKDADLATSPELLEFLGTKPSEAADLRGGNNPHLEEEDKGRDAEFFDFFEQPETASMETPHRKFLKDQEARQDLEDDEEEEIMDPLGIMRSKKKKKIPVPVKASKPKLTIFDEEVDPDQDLFGSVKDFSSKSTEVKPAKDNLKLFDDPDLGGTVKMGDSLLLPLTCDTPEPKWRLGHEEATEDLLRVEDDLEKILNLESKPKPKPKPKPKVPAKPQVLPKTGESSARDTKQREQQIQTMNEMDILQYIQDNEASGNAAPSLF
ncbi:HCLS1-binding protein 3 isoform X1 [Ornithorhynchus anatinus]|uniref:HCLS1-binding protein 3 isoform X1 n=1 Tax=Ornithorhynchus anatinus TaxID=9258 RepID=UPI0010A7865C|nr:HCLS1-binding protein 3 isoform X1 [Ornithorhynchus anatinus]